MSMKKAFKTARIPLLCAFDAEERDTIHLRLMECPVTKTRILANAMEKPLSPFAKNTFLKEIATDTVHLSVKEQDKLVTIGTCDSCGASYKTYASLADNTEDFTCIVCGTRMGVTEELHPNFDDTNNIEVDTEEDEDENKVESNVEEDEEEYTEENEDESDAEDTDEDSVEACYKKKMKKKEGNKEETEEEEEKVEAKADEDLEEKEEAEDEETEEDEDTLEEEDSAVEAASDAEVGVPADSEEKKNVRDTNIDDIPNEVVEDEVEDDEISDRSEESPSGDTDVNPEKSEEFVKTQTGEGTGNTEISLTANLLKLCKEGADKSIDVLSSVGENPVYYIMVKNRPVGLIRKESLSENLGDLFEDSKTFSNAVISAFRNGIEQACDEFKIEAIKVEVPVDEAVTAHLIEERKELEASFEEKKQELMEVLKQSISIASVAINKEIYKNETNPLKDELVSKLTQNGVIDSAKLVNACFEKAMGNYIESVLAKAYELVEKNTEVRNEVAKMVESANYRQPNEVSVEEKVVARLQNSMTPNIETASTKVTTQEKSLRDIIKLNKYRR